MLYLKRQHRLKKMNDNVYFDKDWAYNENIWHVVECQNFNLNKFSEAIIVGGSVRARYFSETCVCEKVMILKIVCQFNKKPKISFCINSFRLSIESVDYFLNRMA